MMCTCEAKSYYGREHDGEWCCPALPVDNPITRGYLLKVAGSFLGLIAFPCDWHAVYAPRVLREALQGKRLLGVTAALYLC